MCILPHTPASASKCTHCPDVLSEKSSPTCTAVNLFIGGPVQHFLYIEDIVSHVNGKGEFHGAPGMNQYMGL